MSILLDTKAIKLLESQLKAFKERAMPFATKAAINSYAFETQKKAKEIIREKMILRNKFTERSIIVQKTNSLRIDEQESRVGSTQEYMREQELGDTKQKRGKYGVAIPTSVSAGQAMGSKPRTKVPRGRFKMSSITLSKTTRGKRSKKQDNIVRIKQALKRSQKFVFLELNTKKGIFEISGTAKKAKIRMVYDISRSSVIIRKREWLSPATSHTKQHMDAIYFKALRFQLERHNLFKKL